jgi:hypothetical protein
VRDRAASDAANQRPHLTCDHVAERYDGRKIARETYKYTSTGGADCEFAGDAEHEGAQEAVSLMTMVGSLLKDVELTPGQLAELRAIDTLYYSRLAGDSAPSGASAMALDDLVLARVRDMLHDEQRAVFDRNRAARHSDEARSGAHIDRRS